MTIDNDRQLGEWQELYERVQRVLRPLGHENASGRGDYWVLDDNWGPDVNYQQVFVFNLDLIRPEIVSALRRLLHDYPDWQIAMAIDIPDKGQAWPEMGLTIRRHEIIDGLKREYFPPEYRGFHYDDARPGTEKD
jgi:hypothetical protein